MEHLLDDIPPLIAGYLPPQDAINFSRTCRKLNSQLSLTVTHPRQILTNFAKDGYNDDCHYGFQIPVISQVSVHSILIVMNWKDQGWGNRKGRVLVVAERENQTNDRASLGQRLGQGQEFAGGRVVYASGIAPHESQRLAIILKPRLKESYHIWYVAGGGGGHKLGLFNVNVQAIVFDEPSRCFGKAHDFVVNSNTFGPWDVTSSQLQFHHDALKTILESASHLLAHGLKIPPPMVSFFDDHGIPEADLSLKLIKSIEMVWNDWVPELSN